MVTHLRDLKKCWAQYAHNASKMKQWFQKLQKGLMQSLLSKLRLLTQLRQRVSINCQKMRVGVRVRCLVRVGLFMRL